MTNTSETGSTRPYLIRALYEWCTDNGLTPYVAVRVDDTVRVPREYVKDGEIVLNISADATSALRLGNDFIEFKARFAGVARDLMIPVGRVIAIYARESGQGMAFPLDEGVRTHVQDDGAEPAHTQPQEAVGPAESPDSVASGSIELVVSGKGDEPEPPRTDGGGSGRPMLKRVK